RRQRQMCIRDRIYSELVHNTNGHLSGEEKNKYTSPEPFIQSNNNEIANLAKKITEGSKNTSDALEKINDYLFKNIRKKNVIGIPDAAGTLKNMEGDCNEHTMLFVALARSLGIPARPAGGVAYLNGRFYFHAWAEAYTDSWRTYDPTWGQSPADVGHIRLVSGGMDRILNIAKYINKLKIEVIEWK
ncbi:MAG: transglutaminase-like domain-containing protein, partial [Deltaproteobacteria bacterium]|nr:transglutaminase-like domain-containing protein [Deltaproteobacteria bacterium]